ncbi:co-chaperone [Gymnopilus junonius]|uniref:Co-chaperone n=1 Tax=Gymnopilus junonius TaxID=109634 RepID=A0A9P5TNT6_GYMJU|nr:co-chaperone [Gymnopilus junonius]
MRLFALASLLLLLSSNNDLSLFVSAEPSGLYPPGLQPLITKGNVLLASGQFSEAAKIYSEAIEQSPADYLLYYKRATAYLSSQRHNSALEDFEKVLSLTSNTFDAAHLMKARIHTRDGHFSLAKPSLAAYIKAKGRDKEAEELEAEIKEGERLMNKAEKERSAELWNACVESATEALRVASHSVQIRTWRAECSLAAGDVESAVGDLTRLSHLLPPSTQLLTHIFRLSYFLLPSSPTPLNVLKQCFHYDPESKPCLALRRMLKSFDKSFAQLDELLAKEDWRGAIKLILSPEGGKNGDLWKRWEEAMTKEVGSDKEILPLVPPTLIQATTPSASPTSTSANSKKSKKAPQIRIPSAAKMSPQRQTLVRALCKSYTHMADAVKSSADYKSQMERWCDELLTLDGCKDDVDGLVGKGEALLAKEEFEEAVRTFERAFEASGRSDRNIHERLQRAQRVLKQSKQKDYYKVVGVSRDADEKTIKKAYRKAAKSAHPDKGGSEAKMAALNEAYEVLSNPELRARYDAGEDPMDPMAQQGGHPFANGQQPLCARVSGLVSWGFPGGEGGFQFHFSNGR